jgi:6-phosphogluconolactonase
MRPEVHRYPDPDTLSRRAADFVCGLAEKSVKKTGLFTMVLAGGKTPRTLYNHLARPPYATRMPWSSVHFFWGDERCVPPGHPDSNFGMAFQALIAKIPVPPENIHRIPGDEPTPEAGARAYEDMLHAFFQGGIHQESRDSHGASDQGFPGFDLIILGVGTDGHTASLFPGDPLLEERKRWLGSVSHPRGSPPVPRITLTLPVINQARCVLFLVSGMEKKDVVRLILNDPETARGRYPAAMVNPVGRVVWFLDRAALT